jgi:hypothetical protein
MKSCNLISFSSCVCIWGIRCGFPHHFFTSFFLQSCVSETVLKLCTNSYDSIVSVDQVIFCWTVHFVCCSVFIHCLARRNFSPSLWLQAIVSSFETLHYSSCRLMCPCVRVLYWTDLFVHGYCCRCFSIVWVRHYDWESTDSILSLTSFTITLWW